jgi:hypothetical protein
LFVILFIDYPAMSCEHCTQGYVLPGEPEGTIVDGAYFHAASAATDSALPSTSAVVLLTDIFGLDLKNSKIIADKLSKELGCDVWVPDLFAPGASQSYPFFTRMGGVCLQGFNTI